MFRRIPSADLQASVKRLTTRIPIWVMVGNRNHCQWLASWHCHQRCKAQILPIFQAIGSFLPTFGPNVDHDQQNCHIWRAVGQAVVEEPGCKQAPRVSHDGWHEPCSNRFVPILSLTKNLYGHCQGEPTGVHVPDGNQGQVSTWLFQCQKQTLKATNSFVKWQSLPGALWPQQVLWDRMLHQALHGYPAEPRSAHCVWGRPCQSFENYSRKPRGSLESCEGMLPGRPWSCESRISPFRHHHVLQSLSAWRWVPFFRWKTWTFAMPMSSLEHGFPKYIGRISASLPHCSVPQEKFLVFKSWSLAMGHGKGNQNQVATTETGASVSFLVWWLYGVVFWWPKRRKQIIQ